MEERIVTRRELLDRWRRIEEDDDSVSPGQSWHRQITQKKEDWFSDAFHFLISLPEETHIWCGYWDLMAPLLETFHNYFNDKSSGSSLKLIWKRISRELGGCSQCICQHHQAQQMYSTEYDYTVVGPLLNVLQSLDEERLTEHLKEINMQMSRKDDPENNNDEVVSLMFEVLMFPSLLDDQTLVNEFEIFIEGIDNSHELALGGHQQYPGIYALLFLKNGRARSIGHRLAGSMGNLRTAADLEPLQPLLKKCISILETDALPSTSDSGRTRVQLEPSTIWLGIKSLLGFLEPPAFEEGILERYPIFLSIVLNHVSDDTPEFSYAINCLRLLFIMLGCKLWLRTTFSPSVIRNTLLGQCFHTRNEKSHKEIFDVFQPFLQSIEALQDGEHEKQRRHLIYFLLHQVTQSSNFSLLMRKNARKIAHLIVLRGYTMNPPSPPYECAHMWGPSLISSLKDSSLHASVRQPAFDLIQAIIVSDAAALISFKYHNSSVDTQSFADICDEDDELPFSHDVEEVESSCWCTFSVQSKLTARECREWRCIPRLWFDALIEMEPSAFPISFSKAVFWSLSRFAVLEPITGVEMIVSFRGWLSSHCKEMSPSLDWQVPTGSDDGGNGNECRNSVDPSTMCIALMRLFKRCTAHFVTQMEPCELWKQWAWESRLAESLILMLLDPNDKARAVTRLILQHVSKEKLLRAGLQFLCSSASSISAVYFGLKYASKLVFLDSFSSCFHNLELWFFIIYKLFKEVVPSPSKELSCQSADPKTVKFQSAGGFLHQPVLDHPSLSNSGSHVVDVKSWDRLCCLLSRTVWPSALKCLVKGKEVIGKSTFQMACIRLLEVLPVIFERLVSSASKLSGSTESPVPGISDFKWLCDLMEWGRSLDRTITNRWRQCMYFFLELFEKLFLIGSTCTINTIEKIISRDPIMMDDLKDQVSKLSLCLSRESASAIDQRIIKGKMPSSEDPDFGRASLARKPSSGDSDDVLVLNIWAGPGRRAEDEIIILSDEDTEKSLNTDALGLSRNKSNKPIQDPKALSKDEMRKPIAGFPKISSSPVKKSEAAVSASVSFRRHDYNVSEQKPSSSYSSSSCSRPPLPVSEVDVKKDNRKNFCEVNFTTEAQERVKTQELSSGSCFRHSDQISPTVASISNAVDGPETGAAFIKKLVNCIEDDSLEVALEQKRRAPPLTKLSIPVPKRQVIQLKMPTDGRAGNFHRLNAGVKRLKPPRMDDWYRPILEIDYFSLVGFDTGEDDHLCLTNCKEVPICFSSSDHYVQIFRPLVLEEFKAQLRNSYAEVTSPEEMSCGCLSILSVERIDDFHLVRCLSDERKSSTSRGCSENDLILFSKQPLGAAAQIVHLVGKVERREKDTKRKSDIIVVRFYLQNASARISKAKRLLIERSKWFVSRIMSITPQIREFQALSSLKAIPILPVILNPIGHFQDRKQSRKSDLSKLPVALQQVFKLSFNHSQLEAICVAIGTHGQSRDFELSLIQGPPGTGKTRTIVAVVSGLFALSSSQRKPSSRKSVGAFQKSAYVGANQREKINQTAAIARAWQDAAYARQLTQEEGKDSHAAADGRATRGRILICAQSNAAVDELISRISNEGLYDCDGKNFKPYLVRVGNAKTVHPNALPFFIDTLVDQRLSEETVNKDDAKHNSDTVALSSLRSTLEKLVEKIQSYEAKRANLRDSDASRPSDISKEEQVTEKSDAAIEAKLRVLYGKKKAVCGELASAQAREKRTSEEVKALKHKLRKSILREAEIVVTTLSGSGGDVYGVCAESISSQRFGNSTEDSLFDAVIIDEAAQALEPATLIPLQLLKSYGAKCIMVGDPKQLPATVFSSVASKFLFECSMFERLQRAGHPVMMLSEQYRMHPEICRFPSLHFYDKKLLNGDRMENKSAPFHENMYLGPYIFFDIMDGLEDGGKNSGTRSLYNEREADAAVQVLRYFKRRYPAEFVGERIGVISPYRSQVSLLRSRFSGAFDTVASADMEFNTVDGFQGREVDILILSTVRASDHESKVTGVHMRSIGFVSDVRRMNVALTRARLSLWIVGNAKTLQTDPNWAALLKDAKQRNLIFSVARPYESLFKNHSCSSVKNPVSGDLEQHSAHKQNRGIGNVKAAPKRVNPARKTSIITRQVPEERRQTTDSKVEYKRKRDMADIGSVEKDPSSAIAPRLDHKSRKGLPSCSDGSDVELHSGSASSTCKEKTKSGSHKPKNDRLSVSEVAGIGPEHSLHVKSSSAPAQQVQRGDGRDQVSISVGKAKDLAAARKRQRDAVNALLSSALISSRKPDTSSKSASIKRPLSPSTAAVVIKPPKPIKAHPTSSTMTSAVHSAGPNKPPSQVVLNEEWKSFKEILRREGGR